MCTLRSESRFLLRVAHQWVCPCTQSMRPQGSHCYIPQQTDKEERLQTLLFPWALFSEARVCASGLLTQNPTAQAWVWPFLQRAPVSHGARVCPGACRTSTPPTCPTPRVTGTQVLGREPAAPTSRSEKSPRLFCRMAYMQWATVTACFQLW